MQDDAQRAARPQRRSIDEDALPFEIREEAWAASNMEHHWRLKL